MDWFTSIPGILVIGGVILLIVAIVLFLSGNKKESTVLKNEDAKPLDTPEDVKASEEVVASEPVIVIDEPEEPVVEIPSEENTVVEPAFGIEMPEEKEVSIYGGNDPLEATQNLSEMEERHEPYGEPVIPIPTEVEVTEIPEIKEEPVEETKEEIEEL